ncbi:MAG: hypothetical protein ABII90_06980 [Bacteroidota bacterium]
MNYSHFDPVQLSKFLTTDLLNISHDSPGMSNDELTSKDIANSIIKRSICVFSEIDLFTSDDKLLSIFDVMTYHQEKGRLLYVLENNDTQIKSKVNLISYECTIEELELLTNNLVKLFGPDRFEPFTNNSIFNETDINWINKKKNWGCSPTEEYLGKSDVKGRNWEYLEGSLQYELNIYYELHKNQTETGNCYLTLNHYLLNY